MAPHKQPTSLVKYTSAESALKILTDSKLRWSAPVLYRDPFEMDHHSQLHFDAKMLLAGCVKVTLAHIFSRDEPRGTSSLIKAVRRWRAEDRFESEEEAQEVLAELLQGMVKQREPDLALTQSDWRKYAGGLRILSLIDGHDNIEMWEQHADRHRGIAIRLACGEDYTLEEPLPVEYSERKPEITALGEQIEALIHQNQITPQDKFLEKFLVKAKGNTRGKEWRLFKTDYPIPATPVPAASQPLSPAVPAPAAAPASPSAEQTANAAPVNQASSNQAQTAENKAVRSNDASNEGWYEDIQFGVGEVRGIYFGANIAPEHRAAVEKLAQTRYPKAKLFQASVLHNKFELDFERLNAVKAKK